MNVRPPSTRMEGTDPQKEAGKVVGRSSERQQQGSRRWSSMGSIEDAEQHGVVRRDQVEGGGGIKYLPQSEERVM